jgi:2-phospho-L-lactate guanylyltransferase (CobY/MobA/RfbA family)
MPLTFGEPSFENHLVTARRHGLDPRILQCAGLGLDIDAPDDLLLLRAQGGQTASGQLIAEWFERGLNPRNPILGQASEGAVEAPFER